MYKYYINLIKLVKHTEIRRNVYNMYDYFCIIGGMYITCTITSV